MQESYRGERCPYHRRRGNTSSGGEHMRHLKRNLLSVALASATMMLATGAMAQSTETTNNNGPSAQDQTAAQGQAAAPATKPARSKDQTQTPAAQKKQAQQLETVTVTGIRTGIEAAIDTKQNSTSIVEAISAEDIGKLPDVSIAESISRLPGLAAQRVGGRAQVISVRGLSPDFSTTLLNGREMVSTGDNRSVEFDQYPSELMAGVTVYKTPDAALVGQGLSGTIDMRTVRPLDFADSVVLLSARYTDNSLGSAADSDGNGNRINASWIWQNPDRSWGFAIGYSHSDTPIQENQVGLYEPWQPIGPGWRPNVPAPAGCPAVVTGCPYYSDGIKALRRTGETTRDGIMATLQFRASDTWMSTLDVYWSKAEQEDTANQFEVNLSGYNGGFPGFGITNPVINDNGTFVGGTVNAVYPLVRGMYNKRDDEINAFGWKNEFTVGSASVVADISWSKATRDELSLENNTQLLPAPQLDTLHLM